MKVSVQLLVVLLVLAPIVNGWWSGWGLTLPEECKLTDKQRSDLTDYLIMGIAEYSPKLVEGGRKQLKLARGVAVRCFEARSYVFETIFKHFKKKSIGNAFYNEYRLICYAKNNYSRSPLLAGDGYSSKPDTPTVYIAVQLEDTRKFDYYAVTKFWGRYNTKKLSVKTFIFDEQYQPVRHLFLNFMTGLERVAQYGNVTVFTVIKYQYRAYSALDCVTQLVENNRADLLDLRLDPTDIRTKEYIGSDEYIVFNNNDEPRNLLSVYRYLGADEMEIMNFEEEAVNCANNGRKCEYQKMTLVTGQSLLYDEEIGFNWLRLRGKTRFKTFESKKVCFRPFFVLKCTESVWYWPQKIKWLDHSYILKELELIVKVLNADTATEPSVDIETIFPGQNVQNDVQHLRNLKSSPLLTSLPRDEDSANRPPRRSASKEKKSSRKNFVSDKEDILSDEENTLRKRNTLSEDNISSPLLTSLPRDEDSPCRRRSTLKRKSKGTLERSGEFVKPIEDCD